MSPWPAVAAILLLTLTVAVLVGRAMSSTYRGPRIVQCPHTGFGPIVRITRTGLAEALGAPSLRHVEDCALSPGRILCRQACLAGLDAPAARALGARP